MAVAAILSIGAAEAAPSHTSGSVDADGERCIKGRTCLQAQTINSSSLLQSIARDFQGSKRAKKSEAAADDNRSTARDEVSGQKSASVDVEDFEAAMEAFRQGRYNMTLCTPGSSTMQMRNFRGIICGLAIGVTIAAVLLHLVETFSGKRRWGLISMFIVGYLILIPGVFAPILSLRMRLTEPLSQVSTELFFDSQTCEPGTLVESIWSVISLLFRSGSPLAGAIVGFYGIGVPALKLVLLLVGLALQQKGSGAQLGWARFCIATFRFLSKWDAPKLACYSLLFFTMAGLNWTGQLETDSNLENGFACYLVYCMVTLFGALAVPLPSAVTYTYQKPAGEHKSHATRIFVTSGFLSILFAGLLLYGATLPMMSVHLDLATSPKAQGPLALAAEAMDMNSWAYRTMSLWECLQFLYQRSSAGDFNAAFAWILLTCFVIALTVANMMVLSIAAFIIHRNAYAESPLSAPPTVRSAQFYIDIAHMLKYLSMLDVFILGSYIWVATTTGSFQLMGLRVALQSGLAYLLAAEVVHYCQYYTVISFAKQGMRKTEGIPLHGEKWKTFDFILAALKEEKPVRGG